MSTRYDALVVGSGFGGTFAAQALIEAGWRVLMLERGAWVPRGPHNWEPRGSIDLTPAYDFESSFDALAGGQAPVMGLYSCVGGPSVFYGGVSLRLRAADFEPDADVVGASGARWPFDYAELEPFYTQAERLLGVAGQAGEDPCEPPRSAPYPQAPAALSPTSRLIEQAARGLGLRPFRLPLAIHYGAAQGRQACRACTTCDTFACAIAAKNDLATTLLPALQARGLTLLPETVVTGLRRTGGRVTGVDAVRRGDAQPLHFEADWVVLSAGALSSPHLLLASGLDQRSPAPNAIGAYLTRHANGMVFGLFPRLPDGGREFQKQLVFNDYYFGLADGAPGEVRGKLGSIQQVQAPPPALVRANTPAGIGWVVAPLLSRITGLLSMAEDQPRAENRVRIDTARRDRFGLPRLLVTHRYSARDEAARDALVARSRRILKAAGACIFYTHHVKTFSHAAGTLRAGPDPRSAPLDRWCRLRGLENLLVLDASFMPTGGGVNPSLTIAANALRVGGALAAGRLPAAE